MKRALCAVLFLGAWVWPAAADVIVLTNGDRVTGVIGDTDGGAITVKTELMGDVKIPLSAIESINSETPLTVTLEDGSTVTGALSTEDGTIEITPEAGAGVTAPLEGVSAVRTDAAQMAWEREQERLTNPGWLDFWTGTADLGFATARGNSRTTTINTGVNLTRTTGFDKTKLTFSQIFATQSTTEPFGATANRIFGGARYERDITDHLFAFTFANFTVDEFQDLDLRSVLGGGLGWRIIDTERTKFDFGAGGNWNHENFTGGRVRNSGELNFSEQSTHKINSMFNLSQGLSLFPNMTDAGEYRLVFDSGVSAKLNGHLSWTFGISDVYISNPVNDKRNNDLLVTTGISFTVSQR